MPRPAKLALRRHANFWGRSVDVALDDRAEVFICGGDVDEPGDSWAAWPPPAGKVIGMTAGQGNGKLVRDLIPEVVRAAGGSPEASVLPEEAYRPALRAKLLEEVDELLKAESAEAA